MFFRITLVHLIGQSLKQINSQKKVSVVLVARKVQVEAGDKSDQKLALVGLNFVDVLVELTMFEQVVYPREDGLVTQVALIVRFFYLGLFSKVLQSVITGSPSFVSDCQLLWRRPLLYDFIVIFFVFRQRVKTKHRQDIHIEVVNHQPDVTEAARRFYNLRFELAPQDKINEYFCNLFQRLQVDIF